MVAIKFLVENNDTVVSTGLRRVMLAPPYTLASLLHKAVPGAALSDYIVRVAQVGPRPNPIMHVRARLDTDASLVDAIRGFQRAGRVIILRITQVTCKGITTAPISPPTTPPPYRWISAISGGPGDVDRHVGFRLSFTTTTKNTAITIRHVCVSWYNLFVDGALILTSPVIVSFMVCVYQFVRHPDLS